MKMLVLTVTVLALVLGIVWWRVKPPVRPDTSSAVAVAKQDLATAGVRAQLIDSTLVKAAQRSRDDSVALLRAKRQLVDAVRSNDSLQRELRVVQQGSTSLLILGDSIRATVPMAIGAAIQARDSMHTALEAQQATTIQHGDSALASERTRATLLEQRVTVEQDRSQALAREEAVLEKALRPPSKWQKLRASVPVAGSAAVGAGVGSVFGATGALVGGAVGAVIGVMTGRD